MSAIARCALTLLPASSSGGETTAMPNLPGDTAMMPPPTPLLAGRPVWYSHFPESSYSPAVDITARTLGTFAASMTCLPVTGILAARCQRRRHRGEILRVDADRALTGVEIDRLLPVALDVAVGEHERADRLVALVGVGLGLVDVLQHAQLSSRGVVVEADDLRPHRIRCRSGHHARRRDRARIHQRIHLRRSRPDDRPDAFDRDDRVEPCAGGVDADAFLDRLGPCSWMTWAIVKTLEIDWIETSVFTSPAV